MGYSICRRTLTIAHCSEIADSWLVCNRILVLLCPNFLFGMLAASTLVSWGTSRRSFNIEEHKKGCLEVQAWTFMDFGWSQGAHFERCLATLDKKGAFPSLFPVFCFCFFLGLNLDVWIGKPSTWYKKYCKNQLSQQLDIS